MRLAILFPLLLVAACQSSLPTPDTEDDHCSASRHQALIGTPASSIDRMQLPKGTRVIHPDTVVTQDYRTDRLNIHVNEAGQIERVACG